MSTLRRSAGYTLGGTMIFLVLVALLWEGVFFQMAAYLRTEKALSEHRESTTGCTRATAWALTLLETGLPPNDPYSCRMVPTEDPQKVFVATFQRGPSLSYTVSVCLAALGDDSLPLAPSSFNTSEPSRRIDRGARPSRDSWQRDGSRTTRDGTRRRR
jgi:hypothetical protein